MTSRKNWALIGLACLVLLTGQSSVLASGDFGKLGQTFPEFALRTLNGPEFNSTHFKGRALIVHFRATWCPACQKEMELLSTYYRIHHDEGIEMIGLSVDRLRDRDKVLQKMHEYSFQVAMLRDATSNAIGTPGSLPLTYLIDGQGVARTIFQPGENERTAKNLDMAIKALASGST